MSLLGMLQQSVEMYKNKIAISETNRTVTYGELNALSNQYYDWLEEKGVSVNDIVAIELERSIEAIAAMIAILKHGATYTVINKDYPETRKEYMRQTLDIKITIESVFEVDHQRMEEWSGVTRTEDQMCYVIFTSGTTSLPKAVGIPDRGVVRLLHEDRLGWDAAKTISHISPLEFDASIIEIWGDCLVA